MQNWPKNLRRFTGQMTEMPQAQFISSPTDSGIPKRRRRFPSSLTLLQGNMTFTRTEYEVFLTFFNVTLQGGTLPFLMHDISSGTDKTSTFESPPRITHLVGEGGRPSVVKVSVMLERRP